MDFMTTVKEFADTPIFPWLGWIIMSALVLILSGSILFKSKLSALKKTFGAESLPHWLTLLMIAIWGAIALTLTLGLLILITEIVVTIVTPETEGTFRFLLAKTTALTAVLGAVVALPFTVLRLRLSMEQNRHNQDVLYNDKLHNAITDLHARYQKTVGEKADRRDVWEDDIIRRVGAIDRLQALVVERNEMAPRIARTLCVYLKEMSREHPAVPYPEDRSNQSLISWRSKIAAQKRADMEAAAQVLGRLPSILKLTPKTDRKRYKEIDVDLSETNLQGMALGGLDFCYARADRGFLDQAVLNGANLYGAVLYQAVLNGASLKGTKLNLAVLYEAVLNGARLDGAALNAAWFSEARLDGARLDGAVLDELTDLRAVHAKGAALRSVSLKDVRNLENLLDGAFGDASVILSEDAKPLAADKWPDTELEDNEFEKEWELFKKAPSSYIPPQLRDKP
ncbi:MAG: pentapeptide repeat-containing protein [Rhodobacteraceae bacterium]|nr:pentapeptide repeat-containing protein [Paracoccaceae bacterium]